MSTAARPQTRAEASALRARQHHAAQVSAAPSPVAAAGKAWDRVRGLFKDLPASARDDVARRVTAALMAIADDATLTSTRRGP